jgi:hypothetical protein
VSRKPNAKLVPAEKPTRTLWQHVELWFLPIVFVAIGGVIVWTIWHAIAHPSR